MNLLKRAVLMGFILILYAALAGCQDDSARENLAKEQQRRTMDSQLDMYILDQNAVLPVMQDKNTRWDSVSRKGDLFYYNFSVVNLGAGSFSKEIFDQAVAQNLINQTCQDPKRKDLIDKGYTVVFSYVDENKNPLTEIRVSKDQCNTRIDE